MEVADIFTKAKRRTLDMIFLLANPDVVRSLGCMKRSATSQTLCEVLAVNCGSRSTARLNSCHANNSFVHGLRSRICFQVCIPTDTNMPTAAGRACCAIQDQCE